MLASKKIWMVCRLPHASLDVGYATSGSTTVHIICNFEIKLHKRLTSRTTATHLLLHLYK